MTGTRPRAHVRRRIRCFSVALIAGWCFWASSFAQDSPECGDLKTGVGPFDYRTADRKDKEIVERFHFTPDIESLRGGGTGLVGADLDYTLRAFPNHPRALRAMMRLAEKEKTNKPRGARYTVACYFDRALRRAPDDGTVRVLFGIYLMKSGEKDQAIKQLEAARELGDEDANLHYNLGLAYFDLKDYDKALMHAQKAYKLGFPLPGLRDKLRKAGKWRDG
jgi:hypothetical protein